MKEKERTMTMTHSMRRKHYIKRSREKLLRENATKNVLEKGGKNLMKKEKQKKTLKKERKENPLENKDRKIKTY